MKPLTDEEWVERARERIRRGETWQSSDRTDEGAGSWPAAKPGTPPCPYCPDRSPLTVFERPGATAVVPLWYCTICYGFWAPAGSIEEGVTGSYLSSPALDAPQAPRRCRACFGHLMLDWSCSKCGRALPPLDCPGGHGAMERFEREGVTLDTCAKCKGVWFDIGEIAAVYHLSPAQNLLADLAVPRSTDDMPPDWLRALAVITRLFFPLIGL